MNSSQQQTLEQSVIGRSTAMTVVRHMIASAAPTVSTVLICGERGSGKGLVAQSVHAYSPRANGPFVVINCGAVSSTQIETELFGCENDGCTGEARSCAGAIERANKGTLLLDDVTGLPPELQARLVRVLETGRVRRVGAASEVVVDVRVLAATERSPAEAIVGGYLREDLYFRLAVVLIRLPALRERREDVAVLVEHFLADLNRRQGRDKRLSLAMRARLQEYDWPGNVRQLRSAVERAFGLCDEVLDVDLDAAPARTHGSDADGALFITLPVGSSLFDVERAFILATLDHFGGDKRRAATALGCSVKTLYNKLHVYRRQLGHVAAAS